MGYKKNISILFILFISIFLIFFFIENKSFFNNIEKTLLFILSQKDNNYLQFFILMIFLNFFYFLTPLPVFPLIILNGFVFGHIGFVFSIIFITLGSALIFSFSKFFLKKNLSNSVYGKFIKSKIKKYKFIKKSENSTVFLSRYIIPYFFHNIFFGFYNLNIKFFLLIILLAEIPLTFATNNIGMSFNSFVLLTNFSIYDLFLNYQFIVPLIFILFIVLISGTLKKIIVKKSN